MSLFTSSVAYPIPLRIYDHHATSIPDHALPTLKTEPMSNTSFRLLTMGNLAQELEVKFLTAFRLSAAAFLVGDKEFKLAEKLTLSNTPKTSSLGTKDLWVACV